MTGAVVRGSGGRLAGLLVVLGVLLGACSEQAPPQERFAAALAATLDQPFRFEVVLEADQAALDDLGETAGAAAAILSGIRLRGTVDGDDTELALDALGGTVVELRQVAGPDGADAVWVRAGVVDLLASVGVEDFAVEAEVLAGLEQAGAADDVLGAVARAFDGEWIGVRGRVQDIVGEADRATGDQVDAQELFGPDLESFLDRWVDVSDLGDGILHLDLRLGELLRAAADLGRDLDVGREVVPDDLEDDLAALPTVVPGDVRVVDGVVEEMAFDVAAAARDLGTPVEGRVVVRIRITDHGAAGPVAAPEGVEPLSSDDLDAALAAILGSLGLG